MRKIKVTIGALLALLAASFTVIARADVSSQLAGLLSGFTTYRANFQQVTYDQKKQVQSRSSGSLLLMRPGHFRWEVKSPNHQILITNGKILWIYDVDLAQVSKRALQAEDSFNPARLLSGSVKDLTQQFVIKLVSQQGKTLLFQLTPRSSKSMFKSIQLQFVGAKLSKMWVTNTLGQQTLFAFNHIKLNIKIDKKLFDFKAPKGVDVISG